MSKYDICIVGGAGHIGAPLAIIFANKGLKVLIYDLNQKSMDTIANGNLPFSEKGHEPFLKQALDSKNLFFTNKSYDIKHSDNVVITIGTPVDEFQNPKLQEIIKCIDDLPIHSNQLLILRSTLFPGTTDYVKRYLEEKNLHPKIAFCPERIVEGEAFKEMQELPQIISGVDTKSSIAAQVLFNLITPKIVHMKPMEAEFAKLISNTYRYIQFAAANQFYEMATGAGLSYTNILAGAKQDYARLRDLPKAGFAAGPCLLKDTLQLCAFSEGRFPLGHAAVQANEGLPAFLVSQLEDKHNLLTKTVGLLGMAFKANIDDPRTSLSYKLKKILAFKAKKVLTSDPFVLDPDLLPIDDVIKASDILIVCVPHTVYNELHIRFDLKNKEVINIWND